MSTVEIGSLLRGRYEIVAAMTEGGMGSLFEARDHHQEGRRCALKQLHERLREGEHAAIFRAKFESETEFLKKMDHPGVPRLWDSFIEDDGCFMVMEFIQGRNLEQELEERIMMTGSAFPLLQMVQDVQQVLEILIYIHNLTPPIVHRDIKPANLIREHPSGRIRLVDFGIARAVTLDRRTQTQVGTLTYSPLEQIQGRAEPRSDLYSLGATMHHLLTGNLPTPLEFEPLVQSVPGCDARFSRWVDKATAYLPDHRFPDAQMMLQELLLLIPTIKAGTHDPPIIPLTRPLDIAPNVTRLFPDATPFKAASSPVTERRRLIRPASQTPNIVAFGLLAILLALGWRIYSSSRDAKPIDDAMIGAVLSPAETPTPEMPLAPITLTPEPTPTPTPTITTTPTPAPSLRPEPVPEETPKERETPPIRTSPPQPQEPREPSYPKHYPNENAHVAIRPKRAHQESAPLVLGFREGYTVNLPSEWNRGEPHHYGNFMFQDFHKEAGEAHIKMSLKVTLSGQARGLVHNSFMARRNSWKVRTDLPGVDLAVEKMGYSQQELEALVVRPGRYYLIRVECRQGNLSDDLFRTEAEAALAGVDID